jgi:hypothetical protein
MERLQMVKFMLKQTKLNFTRELKYEEEDAELDNEVQDRTILERKKAAEFVDMMASGEEEIVDSDSDSWEDEAD